MLSEPQCLKRRCVHFLGVSDADEQHQAPICTAFPDGIPSEIAYGNNPHATPYPGDHGIQFEEAK
jgi:hypothetical protein